MSGSQDIPLHAQVAAHNNAGRFDEGERLARACLVDRPDDAKLLTALAVSLIGQTEYGLALRVVQRALKHAADFFERHALLRELIVCHAQTGQIEAGRDLVEAHRASYDRGYPSDLAWPGIYLWMLGLTQAARESHQAALSRYPGDPYLAHQLGTAEMCLGDREGMQHFKSYTSRAFWRSFYPEPDIDVDRMWQGESLEGKSILVRSQGGVGDFIHFIRYARVLRELGARDVVIVLPTERIRGFLGSCPEVRIGTMDEIQTTDYWVSTFGLCNNLFIEHGTLSAPQYLHAPRSALAQAQLRLIRQRAAGRRCIAISWHSDMADGSLRSIPLGTLLPLFGLPNIHWVITQRGVALKQFMDAGLNARCSVIGETSSFDDTSALMAGLDGVVTVESYSLHMAGALGVPTWFMAGRALDWRHLNEETQSVWYPSVSLVRQPVMGDWRTPVATLKAQLLRL